MTSCLYAGWVRHRRHRPRVHDFRYRLLLAYLDLDALDPIDRTVRTFSVNRWNLWSFFDRDHLDGRPAATAGKVRRLLARHGIHLGGGSIRLLTQLRVLGYVFNPISLYYCHDGEGTLAAVVAEVNNTFGERHLYLLDRRPNDSGRATARFRAAKAMHVSPFLGMDCVYDFTLPPGRRAPERGHRAAREGPEGARRATLGSATAAHHPQPHRFAAALSPRHHEDGRGDSRRGRPSVSEGHTVPVPPWPHGCPARAERPACRNRRRRHRARPLGVAGRTAVDTTIESRRRNRTFAGPAACGDASGRRNPVGESRTDGHQPGAHLVSQAPLAGARRHACSALSPNNSASRNGSSPGSSAAN